MTGTLLLLGLAVAVSAATPAVARRGDWAIRAPGLSIAVWCASVISVLLAVVLAAVVPAITPERAWETACALWRICVTALHGGHGWAGWLMAAVGLALVALLLARLAVTTGRAVPAAVRWRRRHASAVRLVGHTAPGSDVTVVYHDEPAAYVVSARPKPVVVVTSAAVETLSAAELAAVVAHERAHAAGRHQLLVTALRVLSEAFPASRLFGQAHTQVSRLVEVCADDAATRQHSRLDLARALVTMAEARAATRSAGVAPATALAAAGGDTATRLHRLLNPPAPPRLRVRLVIAAAAAALPLLPVVVVALTRWSPELMDCPRLFG